LLPSHSRTPVCPRLADPDRFGAAAPRQVSEAVLRSTSDIPPDVIHPAIHHTFFSFSRL